MKEYVEWIKEAKEINEYNQLSALSEVISGLICTAIEMVDIYMFLVGMSNEGASVATATLDLHLEWVETVGYCMVDSKGRIVEVL